ncbi:protein timeless isoform X3 [Toxorhynchites rutilus septentrionalis]|uniref:protein timeless isoform X3 n=1 Tax=Toxorhynchites rutilus septentrionalis TaxID=329112 RepID=UPI00247A9179|nr:protein timeless isoform X3 [Toxorhynchites rutilus septentrionalis]
MLAAEDTSLRTFRRAIGFGQNVKNDIVPLLIHAKDPKVIETTIRLLVKLTVPAECLVPMDVISKSEIGRHTIFELNSLLITSKQAFTEWSATKAILDHMRFILKQNTKLSVEDCESINSCLLLLRNILHVMEGTAAPGTHSYPTANQGTSFQNQIIWNMFTERIDKLLIHLMTCPQRAFWTVTMAQLVALMYKDQHISTLQKLLDLCFESTLSDSSEDNESNTSPPMQCSGYSSPLLISDSCSDFSDKDNGKSKKESGEAEQPKKSEENDFILTRAIKTYQLYQQSMEEDVQIPPTQDPNSTQTNKSSNEKSSTQEQSELSRPSAQGDTAEVQSSPGKGAPIQKQTSLSENSDCGYGTQAEKESISTSSNEDDGPNVKPVHQKPPPNQKQRFNVANKQRKAMTFQEKKELRRKKLIKRSKSNIINMKGMKHHDPTDVDISNILKEFTVDFLLKGYGCLVRELHAQLLSDLQLRIDTSHFFWLVTYFMKFASQLELDMEHINGVLSFDIISYLTYEGVILCEQLQQLDVASQTNPHHCLRRLHLVITAIRELLQAIDTYTKSTHLTKEDEQSLRLLQFQISSIDHLKCLFVLLLRCYNPALQSKQYLQDLIVTNHMLLLLLDSVREHTGASSEDLLAHIEQFASAEVMHHYGLLLEDFRNNGAFVNDCIFTMMHHVGGDLGKIDVLFQPIILKAFSQICDTEYGICEDWSDLLEFVIHKFISTRNSGSLAMTTGLPKISTQICSRNRLSTWTQEEKTSLQWYYVQCQHSKCLIADISNLFQENGNQQKLRVPIIEQLWEQDIISFEQYDQLMKVENPDYERNVQTPAFSVASEKSDNSSRSSRAIDDIQVLRDRLLKENKGKMIVWLQKSLLDCYLVKLKLCSDNFRDNSNINALIDAGVLEPVSYHCIIKKKCIPVIPWNQEQFAILSYQPFVLLLHKLGFHMPTDAKRMFIRIPEFWTADILYDTALKLGPLAKSMTKYERILRNKELFEEKRTQFEPRQTSENDLDDSNRMDESTHTNRCATDVTLSWGPMNSERITNLPGPSKVAHPSKSPSGRSPVLHSLVTMEASHDELTDGLQLQQSNDNEEMDHCDGPVLVEQDDMIACETASVTSNLTRMDVSDEDEKHDMIP